MLKQRGTFLAAVALTFGALSSPSPARAADVKYLPDDTELVFTVHWKKILDSELVKGQQDALDPAREMLEQFPGVRLARRGLKDAGFDLFRDLHRITYAGPRGLDPKSFFLVLEGKFDAAKLSTAARAKAGTIKGVKSDR